MVERVTFVATLIVDPASRHLMTHHLRTAAGALGGSGPARWLAEGLAADLPFDLSPSEDPDRREDLHACRAALAAERVDMVVQPAAGRRKRLLVADMDSTLIQQECIDELADAVGLREKVAAITERSMRGEIAFEPALRERVALLRGFPLAAATRVFHDRITFMPGARSLVRTMRAHGAATVIASGGFTLFTALVAKALGFDEHRANTLLVADGVLTGEVDEPVLGRDAKAFILREFRDAHRLSPQETLAVGDGANDLAMLADAGLGVAFRAKPAVAAAAQARVEHGDLSALLYLQGYSEGDIKSADQGLD